MSGRIKRALAWYAGFLALGSGAALLATIVLGASLLLALTVAILVVALAFAVLASRTPPAQRDLIIRVARTGLVAGVLATIAYDASKAILSVADPSPYNPFEAVRIFGVLLIGDGAPPALTWVVGAGYHLLNGVTFAIAFAQFFGPAAARSPRWALGLGMAWGLVLETFQLALFPGFFSIAFVAEFQTISFAAHLVYGATLGLVVHRRLARAPAS